MPSKKAALIAGYVVHTPSCAWCKSAHDLAYIPCKPQEATPYEEDGRTLALLGEARCPKTGKTVYIMQVTQ